ncbi:MAG TPA: bifunctional folylpolyglutamate synthase/dihydrofolate synthase [Chloroflexi bacterium]|jgi:dihydrofolate synthase/folylpolyglutamate synthase|nr:bifunctional folylpolyglutamate synthase/dihydrofolate synthase [Chloroflexota bacterium]
MLTYREALCAIFRRTDFERGDRPPYAERVWRLSRMEELLSQIGNPHRAYPSVHIAGTKGKGSTTAMIDAILRAAGYRTGMYTSPHLHTFRERIRLQGKPISERALTDLVERLLPILNERPEVTVFEIITALAMWHHAEERVDFGVFEVGLGGRLDATNVITPRVSVITSISLDHVKVLGETIDAIAREKAGIIKPGVPVVSAPQREEALAVIAEVSAERGASLTVAGREWRWRLRSADISGQRLDVYRAGHEEAPEYPDLHLPLLGAHQLENTCAAVAAIEILREQGVAVEPDAVRRGLSTVRWPGRLEVLSRRPLVVVDGAHNIDSIRRLLQAVDDHLPHRHMWLIFGAGQTHNPHDLLDIVHSRATTLYTTRAHHPKATPADDLAAIVAELGGEARAIENVDDALRIALGEAAEDDLILVTGSLFVAAEARAAWAALNGLAPYPSDPPGVY